MPAPTPITLAVCRFEDLLGRGLRGVLEADPSLAIVADDVEQGRIDVVLRAHHPSVAILDVDALPNLAAIRELGLRHPHTRLVLLASRPTPAECAQLLAFGASACLGRDTQARDVLTAIHLASRGLQLVPRDGAPALAGPAAGSHLLTPREAEVLPLLQGGRSNAQIATTLGVGIETIRSHARNIYRKLGVTSRRDLGSLPIRPMPVVPLEPPAARPVARRAPSGPSRHRRHGSLRR